MAVIAIVVALAVGGDGGGTPERVQVAIPADTSVPTDPPEPTVNIAATVGARIQQGLAERPTPSAKVSGHANTNGQGGSGYADANGQGGSGHADVECGVR